MIIIDSQPVNFQTDPFDNPYIDEVKYQQLVQQGDITQFQFQLYDEVNSENVLQNPDFKKNLAWWTQTSYWKLWEWNNGTLYYKQTGENKKSSTITQYGLVAGTKYAVKIAINRSQNGYFEIILGKQRIAQLTAGVHNVSGLCEGGGQLRIKFIPTTGATRVYAIGEVDYIYVTPTTASNHRFVVEDLEDSTIALNFQAINDYLSDPYTQSADAQFVQKSLTMQLDWQTKGVANGCYKIGVCDADVNTNLQCGVRNSDFYGGYTTENGTAVLPNWAITDNSFGTTTPSKSGAISFGISGGSGQCDLVQTGLKIGVTYDYEINIISISGTGATISVFCGTANDTYTTAGVKTGSLTCAGLINFILRFDNTTSGSAVVGYMRIQAQNSDLEVDYYSNPFYLATTHHRTMVVNCNNTENVYGLNYEQAIWSPRARLRGYVAPDDNAYKTTREVGETTSGRRDVYYLKRRKSQLLVVENEPEFMHDWLSLLGGHDHVMVNNKEYFIDEDEYPPVVWDYWRVLGNVQIPMSAKQQVNRKVVTGEYKTPQFITDTDGSATNGGKLIFNDLDENPEDLNPIGIELIDPADSTIGLETPPSPTQDDIVQ
jgi:hypothetical protein